MLHGNGTNGAQNNTFLDSSTNNFTITRNGNTTQGSFSPFSQTGWSNYFDGASALTIPNSTAFNFDSGDFTVEAWVYFTSLASTKYTIMGKWGSGLAWIFQTDSTTKVGVALANNGSYSSGNYFSEASLVTGQWMHLAVSRNGTTLRVFKNGTLIGTFTSSENITTTETFYVARNGGASQDFPGYISNARVVKGTAVYTSSFTPSTTPLTAITGTSVLTCQDNRFVDDSANNFAISTAGTPSVQAFSPFVPAYITPTTYSNYFDGTGDYLSIASGQTPLDCSTGDFTLECWINAAPYQSGNFQYPILSNVTGSYNASSTVFSLGDMNTTPVCYLTGPTQTVYVNGSLGDIFNRWTHLALTRSGNTFTIYKNGVSIATGTNAGAVNFNNGGTYIGRNGWDGYGWYGCISNLRLVKGTVVYTANFTPPTAPLTNITNTSLLTCQNSTFIDNSTNNFTITATGNVQPVTSPTPFPAKVDTTTLNSAYSTSLIGGGAYFDGTGDYLRTPTDAAFALGTSDFTFETWIYPTVAGTGNGTIWDNRNPSGGIQGFIVLWSSGNVFRTLVGAPNAWDIDTSSSAYGANQWLHYALVRSGSTFKIFINGVLTYTSGTVSGSMGTTAVYATIGSAYDGSGPFPGGYMSGYRLVKGTALYSTSFAPAIAPPTPVTNTQLLTNFTNGAIFDNTAKNTIETGGNAQISTTQSKWGGSSMYFDGTGDSLSMPANAIFNLGSSDFTIEFWLYPPSVSYGAIMYSTNNGSKTDVFAIYSYGSGQSPANSIVALVTASGGGAWSLFNNQNLGSTTAATWQHVALVRNGSTFKGYMNGVAGFTVTSSSAVASFNGFSIASNGASGDYFTGYIDDLRITRAARYLTNFTPPTSQLQDQ
jgi:hypothetical protein